jgi:hypothetical protein
VECVDAVSSVPRVVGESREDCVRPSGHVKEVGVGLQRSRPKVLRTRLGDLPLVVDKGGVGSTPVLEDELGLLEEGRGPNSGGTCGANPM